MIPINNIFWKIFICPNKEKQLKLIVAYLIQEFAKSFGQHAPDKNMIVLPNFLTKRNVWQIYEEENFDPSFAVSYSAALNLMKTKFGAFRLNRTLPHVIFSKYSTHSCCDICVDLEVYQRREMFKIFLRYYSLFMFYWWY